MNKLNYKIIFNRTLNRLVVVSELAKSVGKAVACALSSGAKFFQNLTALFVPFVRPQAVSRLHLAVMMSLGLVFVQDVFADVSPSNQPQVLQIRPDKSVAGNLQPQVLSTANGIPQVNIQTPSAAGVSRNVYSQFDVDKKGAVLNNARKAVATQTAGWVQGNPNLARGEAKVILNEVNSVNPSQFQGYMEVAGKKADVVIANPSGIHCDGCGVINAARATFTTGKPELQNGELRGFDVRSGRVLVGQNGLDSRADYTDIIAERAEIDGGVWAKKLAVTTGKNHVNATNDDVVYVGNSTQEQSQSAVENEKNRYAVDVSALGGMYADQIKLIDNGSGLGVRNAGHIGASAGNVEIDSQGRIVNSGTIQAQQNLAVHTQNSIEMSKESRLLAQQGNVTISTPNMLSQSGVVSSLQQTNIKAAQLEQNISGEIHGGQVHIEVPNKVINRGLITSQQDSATSKTLIRARNIENTGMGRIYGDNIALMADTLVNQDEDLNGHISSAIIAARQSMNLGAKQIINQSHYYFGNTKGATALYSNGDFVIGEKLNEQDRAVGNARALINRSALIEVRGKALLNAVDIQNHNDFFATELQTVSDKTVNWHYIVPKGYAASELSLDMDLLRWESASRGRNWFRVLPAPDEIAFPKNGDVKSNYLPSVNQCIDEQSKDCNILPQSYYFPDNPVWQYFGIKPTTRDNLVALINNVKIPEKPVEPIEPTPPTTQNAKEQQLYQEALVAYKKQKNEYDAEYQTYLEAQTYFDEKVKPAYLQWVNDNAVAFNQLSERITAHNQMRKNVVGSQYRDFWQTNVTRQLVKEDVVTKTQAGEILVNGDAEINAEHFVNDKSRILIGGNLLGQAKVIDNIQAEGRQFTEHYGDTHYSYLHKRKSKTSSGRNKYRRRDKDWHYGMLSETQKVITLPVATVFQQYTFDNDSFKAKSTGDTLSLPSSSLYKLNPDSDVKPLIETDPNFTDRKKWLSSDYMYRALRSDPQMMLKRLGDGYYEQQLVRDQLAQLMGHSFNANQQDFEAQYKMLMNNGINVAKAFNWNLGIKLNAAQIVQLTNDIVWLENQTITLPNGRTQTVLTPRVYLASVKSNDFGKFDGRQSLISAQNLALNAHQIHNNAVMAARQFNLLQADDITLNNGVISGDSVALKTAHNLLNLGGSIQANQALLLDIGGDMLHQSTTKVAQVDAEGYHHKEIQLDRTASLDVKNSNGVLQLQAKNIHIQGGDIRSAGEVQLQAKDTLNLMALNIKTEQHQGNNKHWRNEHHQRMLVSQIQSGGNVRLQAENINSEGAILKSDKNLTVQAMKELRLASAQEQLDYDEYHQDKVNAVVRQEKYTSYNALHQRIHQGAELSADNILIQAGNQLQSQGLTATAQHNIQINAQDIALDVAMDNRIQSHWEKHKKSGVTASLSGGVASIGVEYSKSGGDHNSYDQTARATQIIAKNALNIIATKQLILNATNIGAGNDVYLQGEDVKFNAVNERHTTHDHQYSKSVGASVGVTYSPLWAASNAAKDRVQSQGGLKNQSLVGTVTTVADAAYEAGERFTKIAVMQMGAKSSSVNREQELNQAVTGQVTAGNNLTVVATKGNVFSQGTDFQAENNFTVAAQKDVNFDAAKSWLTANAVSKSKGMGFDTSHSWLKEFGMHMDKSKENNVQTEYKTSAISVGGTSLIKAGENLSASGIDMATTNNVVLLAGKNIHLGTTKNENLFSAKSTGIGFGSEKISDTEQFTGIYVDTSSQNNQQALNKGSVIGSEKGNISIYAGQDYQQDSSALLANNGDLNIVAGQNIISTAQDNISFVSGKASNTKFGLFAKVSSPLIDVVNLAKEAKSTIEEKADDRLKALKSGILVYQGYQLCDDLASGALLKVEMGAGVKHNQSSYEQKSYQSQSNIWNGANNVTVLAKNGKIALSHIDISTKNKNGDITPQSTVWLNAKNGILLDSGRDEFSSKSKQVGGGVQVGVGAQVGAGTGAYAYVEAGYQQGKQSSLSHQKHNSHIRTDYFKAETAGNMTLKGTSIYADKIDANVNGDLNIISQQDYNKTTSSQSGANIRVQVSLGTAWSVSGSFNQQNSKGETAQVAEQAGFFAGKGGYHITANNVSLIGGAILSQADKLHNQLTANDFSYRDIKNYSNAKASGIALMAGFSVNRDQTSQEDEELNKTYRDNRPRETFYEANPNQKGASALKFGLTSNDVHSADLYALSKLALVNGLGNVQDSASHQTMTKSVITDGIFNISNELGKQQISTITKSTESQNEKVENVNAEKLINNVQLQTEINKFLLSTTAMLLDESYRTMFIAEHRMMGYETDENGKPIKDQRRLDALNQEAEKAADKKDFTDKAKRATFIQEYTNEQLNKGYNIYKLYELSDQQREHIKPVTYTAPNTGKKETKYFVAFNGIFNDVQAAAKFAVQNYIATTGEDKNRIDQKLYKNVYFVHHPKSSNKFSELLIAGYEKWFVSTDNSTKQAISLLNQKGNSKEGLYLGAHSRGTLTISNALQTLMEDKSKLGEFSNVTIKMVGPAANVTRADNILYQLQTGNVGDRKSNMGSIIIENHQLDPVGSWSVVGGNPYTVNTNTLDKGWLAILNDVKGDNSSSHNCYGLGQKQCIKDGYRIENDLIMHPQKTIYQLNHKE